MQFPQSFWLATPFAALVSLLAPTLSLSPPASLAVTAPVKTDEAGLQQRFAQLPLAFERNQGQTDAAVKFLARGPGYSLFLTPTEAVFSLQAAGNDASPHGLAPRGAQATNAAPATVVRMALSGANANPQFEGLQPQAANSNYFTGADQAQWQRDVAQFGKVRARGVYPGIDVVYYGKQRELEYDFVVAPGADPGRIGLTFNGPDALRLDGKGNLVLATAHGDLLQHRPVAYQDIDGRRVAVEAAYRITAGKQVAIALGAYDRDHALVIDPVLSYSTYLGGTADDFATDIAVDGAGNMYVTGYTASTTFPTTTPIQAANGGVADVFVTKINAAGTARVYSTYLGGDKFDAAYGIAVDGAGNAYITGTTASTGFPVKSAAQATLVGTSNAFVAKINAAGSELVYSTYFGAKSDFGTRIAVDASGNAYASGYTQGGLTFSGTPFQGTFGGTATVASTDGYLVKFDAAGVRGWGTYLGGSANDFVEDVVLDASGNVYVAGFTSSPNFPTRNALQGTHGGNADAFLTKFTSAGAAVYSTYFGGSSSEGAAAVGVDSAGNAYIAGQAYGNTLPLLNSIQPQTGDWDGFVTKISANGQSLVYSTYLGGGDYDEVTDLVVGADGSATAVGMTSSTSFPTASPWQPGFSGGDDGFISRLNPQGTDFTWSSMIGGLLSDVVLGATQDSAGQVYLAGRTLGQFPTATPLQATAGGGKEGFVVRIGGATPTSLKFRRYDVNDDGRADIFWHNATTGANAVWNNGIAAFVRPVSTQTSAAWVVAGIGDFNGDHRGDVLWRNTSTGENEVWLSTFDTHMQLLTTVAGADWYVAGLGDFNGDGKSDIFWRRHSTGANVLWLAGDSAQRVQLATVSNPDWKFAVIGDFNADGKDDVVWRNTATGGNDMWRSAQSTQRVTMTAVTNLAYSIAGAGDFNADGKDDLLWRNSSTGANDLWFSANAPTHQKLVSVTDQNWKVAGVGDYGGDGKADILWRNISTGANVIWNSGTSTTQTRLNGILDQAWQPAR
ncbi:DUF7948 domain-containing protein [Lysobacter fragariae]